MRVPLRSARQLGLVAWISTTFGVLITVTSAQGPTSVYGMAYATIDENTLYVQGGVNLLATGSFNLTSQFYSLDLTKNWDTSNPPWKALTPPTNPAKVSRHSMTVSPNRQSLTIWSTFLTSAVANYSIVDASWTQVPLSTGLKIAGSGLHAAADPLTGAVYIPTAGVFSTKKMAKFSFVTESTILIDVPPPLVTAQDSYSFAWCQLRKSFILFSGNATTAVPFFEYNPVLSKWTTMPSLGATPSFRHRSCLIPAHNGTKMVLFGGDNGTAPSVGNISILDVASMTWTNGNGAPASEARSEMACAASGDNFVVWGGYKVQYSTPSVSMSTTPLVYNLKTKQWTEKFVRIANGNTTDRGSGGEKGGSGGGGTGNGPGSGSGSDLGNGGGSQIVGAGEVLAGSGSPKNGTAIGGGVAGGVVVIAAIAFFAVRRRQQRSARDFEIESPDMSILPSLKNTSNRPNDYTQGKPKQQQDRNIHSTNPQYTSRNEPQGSIGSPPSYAVFTRPQRDIPCRSNSSAIAGGTQDHILEQQHQKSQSGYAARRQNNYPQCSPIETRTLPSSTARAPQGVADPITVVNNEELLEQINSLQAEWNRRQAMMHNT